MKLTNGTRISETGPIRKFEEVARSDGFVWVRALNGNYKGEFLTFRESDLKPVEAKTK